MWQRCVAEIRRGTADILPLSVIYYACSRDMENQWSHQGVTTTATTNIKGFATVKKEKESMKEEYWLWGKGGEVTLQNMGLFEEGGGGVL